MKIFDAHVHLREPTREGIQEILGFLKDDLELKILLILNSFEEYEIVKRNFELLSPWKERFRIALILSKRQNFVKAGSEFFKKNGLHTVIKIHPKKERMKQDEFTVYRNLLMELEFETIVVDNFVYGDLIDHHLSVNFVNYLAHHFTKKNIVMAHSGGCDLLHDLMVTKDKRNIYYEISLTCTYLAESSIKYDLIQLMKFHSSRVLFGSDFPDWRTKEVLSIVFSLFEMCDLDKREQANILYNNALGLYR